MTPWRAGFTPRQPPTDFANGHQRDALAARDTGISIRGNGEASATAKVCTFCVPATLFTSVLAPQ